MMDNNYFPKIDILKRKVKRGTRITLDEACFIIWAELLACSIVWKDFQQWAKENKIYKNKFKWEIWKSIYQGGYMDVSRARIDAKHKAIMESYESRTTND